MERFISPLVAAMIVGSAASGTSSFDGLRTDRYHDSIQHRRPLRFDVAPTVLAVRELGLTKPFLPFPPDPHHRAFLWGLEEDRAAVSAGVV